MSRPKKPAYAAQDVEPETLPPPAEPDDLEDDPEAPLEPLPLVTEPEAPVDHAQAYAHASLRYAQVAHQFETGGCSAADLQAAREALVAAEKLVAHEPVEP